SGSQHMRPRFNRENKVSPADAAKKAL
nr:Chain B, 40S ribosomal protein S26-A [Saccharomyces cerevisiae S288C]